MTSSALQSCSSSHMATAKASALFYDKVYCCDDVIGFGHVLRSDNWGFLGPTSDFKWVIVRPLRNRAHFYVIWCQPFFALSESWRLIIWIGCQKIWCPKTNVINSSTCGWPLALQNRHYKSFHLHLRPRDLEILFQILSPVPRTYNLGPNKKVWYMHPLVFNCLSVTCQEAS